LFSLNAGLSSDNIAYHLIANLDLYPFPSARRSQPTALPLVPGFFLRSAQLLESGELGGHSSLHAPWVCHETTHEFLDVSMAHA
jgi:hypothetical protein